MNPKLQKLLDELTALLHRAAEVLISAAAEMDERPEETTETPPAGTQQTQIASTVKLDAAGLPWDKRIHSAGAEEKRIKADGNWRLKRNVDPALVTQVEAELRGATPAETVTPVVEDSAPPPPPTTDAPPPPATTEAAAPPPPPVEMRIVAGSAYTRPALLEAGHTPEQIDSYELAAAAPAMQYGQLIVKIATAAIPPETVEKQCIALGCPDVGQLSNKAYANLIPQVAAALGLS